MSTTKYLRLVLPLYATVAFAFVGCGPESGKSNPPPAQSPPGSDIALPTGGSTSATDTTTAPVKATPDVKLTAEEFRKEVAKDGGYLINKHAGKLVELTGVVDKALLDFGGDTILFLNAGDSVGERINCPVEDRKLWSKAYPGQTVTLWMNVATSVNDPKPFVWEIKSATGPVPPTIAAEDLLKEFAADQEATEKKYKGKHIILTGEVAEPKMWEKMLTGFSLRSKEKKPVLVCHVIGLGGKKQAAFVEGVAKPGQKVTVLVEYGGYYDGEITLSGRILDPAY